MPYAFDPNALQSKIAILINPKCIQWGKPIMQRPPAMEHFSVAGGF